MPLPIDGTSTFSITIGHESCDSAPTKFRKVEFSALLEYGTSVVVTVYC
jgi:hypothetical protein